MLAPIVINSGNANACTGAQGDRDANNMCELVSGSMPDMESADVLVMSTGVIGKFLPMDKVEKGILAASQTLSSSTDGFLAAADGILTTDAGRKITSRSCQLGSREIRIAGMAKGAGMIGPNMATMLCCILTDAPLTSPQAQQLLTTAANVSFNNISVEGHTSTNDTMLLMANGQAGGAPLTESELAEFAEHLQSMCIELAKKIPADGEGATHLIEICVRGANNEQDARRVAKEVASSNLVKSAIYGGDPNWGRIVSAAGYANVPITISKLSLTLNGIALFAAGEPLSFDTKVASQAIRDNFNTVIELTIGDGPGECHHWTSDLTVEYVRFNSEYTT